MYIEISVRNVFFNIFLESFWLLTSRLELNYSVISLIIQTNYCQVVLISKIFGLKMFI